MKTLTTIILTLFTLTLFGQGIQITGGVPYYLRNKSFDAIQANFIIIIDSSDIIIPAIKVHRIDSVNTVTINTWIDVKFDTLIAAETTYGFTFNADSTGLIASSSGLYYVSGCFHSTWNGTGGQGGAGTRITVNGDEKRCAQTSVYRTNTSSDTDTKEYVGTIRLLPGYEVKLQYKVTHVNMDFEGDATFFDYPIAFSMNLKKISR